MKWTRRRHSVFLIAPFVLAFGGCSEKTEVQEQTKISTPEGTRTITKETKIEDTGNPPSPTTSGEPGTPH